MTDFVTQGMIGVDLTSQWASASAASTIPLPFKPGTRVTTSQNGVAIFARAQSTINLGDCVVFSTYGDSASTTPILRAVPVTTTNMAALGWPMVGFASYRAMDSAYYGWFALNGEVNVNLLTGCNPAVPLYTTATAGCLDDTTVSAGLIIGLTANTSASSGTTVVLCTGNNVVCGPHA